MDAYSKGLNRKQAMWAAMKYNGHQVLPEDILNEFDRAHKYLILVWSVHK